MPAALVQTVKTIDNDASTTSVTSSLTFIAGNMALLGILQYRGAGARTITSVMLDGTTPLQLDKELAQASDGAAKAHVYSLNNVSAGAHTVTVTWATGGPDLVTMFFHEVSGVTTGSPYVDGSGAAATNTGLNNAASGNFITLADSFMYGLLSLDTSSTGFTLTQGSGWSITDATNGKHTSAALCGGAEYKANPGNN